MFEPWASLKCEIEELVAAGDMVIASMHVTGVDAGKIVEWRPI